jgi:antitoxin component YwqK of YwqJK toxin-antitoxin module
MTPSSQKARPGRKVWILLGLVAAAALGVFLSSVIRTTVLPTVPQSELVQRDGRIHHGADGEPFTGIMVDHYIDGTLRARAAFKDGLMDGLCEGWHTNGTLEVAETFRGGVSDGLRTKWHASGAKLSEATIVVGKVEGVFRAWHENGQLAEEIAMKDGQPSGEARSWYPSGFLKAAIGTNLVGKIEHKNWADGECRRWPGPNPVSP